MKEPRAQGALVRVVYHNVTGEPRMEWWLE